MRRATALLVLAILAPLPATAQAVDPAIRDAAARRAGQQQARDAAAERQRRAEQRQGATGTGAPAGDPDAVQVAPGGPCFSIRQVKITGYEMFGRQPDGVAGLKGRCVTAFDIATALQDINKAYQARGYITTRAYVPEQDLSKGVLEIAVVPGRIEGFVYADGRKADRRIAAAFRRTGATS